MKGWAKLFRPARRDSCVGDFRFIAHIRNWVKAEIANAREREKREGKQLLFPITLVPFEAIKQWKLFDADIGIDSAREIREYFIPDFSNWKDHDSYQTAFQRLVKDLKAGASG